MASSQHHSMSVHGKETRSAFIFHKPGNNTTVICKAALDVRCYSISEGVSFSLCKVSFPFHLKVICTHFEKKKLSYITHSLSTLYWHDCLFSLNFCYHFGVEHMWEHAIHLVFILFHSLYISLCYNNFIVNNLFFFFFCKCLH